MQKIKTLAIYMILLAATQGFGQTILKQSYFSSHVLGVCADTSRMVKVAMDPATAALKVYCWTGVFGEVDLTFPEGEKPKTTKGKLGKFIQQQSAINAANNNDQAKTPDIGCLSVRKLTFEDIMTTGNHTSDQKGAREFYKEWSEHKLPLDRLVHQTVYPRPMRSDVTYQFKNKERCGTDQVKIDDISMIDPVALRTQFPDLGIGVVENSFFIINKGEGLLGTKNRKNYIETYRTAVQLDSITVRLAPAVEVDRPQSTAITVALADYMMYADKDPQLQWGDHQKFTILRGNKSDDKWSMYQDFVFVKYDDQGKLLQQVDCKTEYLREPRSLTFAYDKKGNPVGVLAIFSSFPAAGAKSRRDPSDNNHELWYFDLEGKEKFHYTFTHGDNDNPRAVFPVLAIDDNGTLEILNVNNTKLLKLTEERLKLNDKGIVSAEPLGKDDISGHRLPIASLFTKTTFLEDGNFLITEAVPHVGGSSFPDHSGFIVITPDFKVVTGQQIDVLKPEIPKVDYLGKFGNDYKFVITYDGRNYFISSGENNAKTVFPGENDKLVSISKSMLGNNYVFDATTRKVYALYEHRAGNGLGYAVVVGM